VTFDEYTLAVEQERVGAPEMWSDGMVAMTVLSDVRPDLFASVRGRVFDLDPMLVEDNLGRFTEWLSANWTVASDPPPGQLRSLPPPGAATHPLRV
jgi:hypothetical protein